MPFRELIAKSMAFGLVALACIAGGVFALYGPHAYNDYLNGPVGILLILIGLGVGGIGTVIIGLIIVDARRRAEEEKLRVTPRPGPLGPPPPWGMSDVGRPDRPPTGASGGGPTGGGTARLMSVRTSNLDGVLLVIGLLVITTLMLIWLAPIAFKPS